jgi:hypothetical protein
VGQGTFDEFGGHTQEGRGPHPEQGCGAADIDGQADAADVACADGAGQGGGQGLKMGGVTGEAFFFVPAGQNSGGMAEETYLGEFEVEGEKKSGAKEQVGEPAAAAQVAVQGYEKIVDGIHCTGLRHGVYKKSLFNTMGKKLQRLALRCSGKFMYNRVHLFSTF